MENTVGMDDRSFRTLLEMIGDRGYIRFQDDPVSGERLSDEEETLGDQIQEFLDTGCINTDRCGEAVGSLQQTTPTGRKKKEPEKTGRFIFFGVRPIGDHLYEPTPSVPPLLPPPIATGSMEPTMCQNKEDTVPKEMDVDDSNNPEAPSRDPSTPRALKAKENTEAEPSRKVNQKRSSSKTNNSKRKPAAKPPKKKVRFGDVEEGDAEEGNGEQTPLISPSPVSLNSSGLSSTGQTAIPSPPPLPPGGPLTTPNAFTAQPPSLAQRVQDRFRKELLAVYYSREEKISPKIVKLEFVRVLRAFGIQDGLLITRAQITPSITAQVTIEKLRVDIFTEEDLHRNRTHHTFALPHRLLTTKEVKAVMKKYCLKEKEQLPHMLRSYDFFARYYGYPIGGVVEIDRTLGYYNNRVLSEVPRSKETRNLFYRLVIP